MIRQDWSTMKKLMFAKTAAGGKAVEDTATGNPLTFLTDLARPLKSLLIPFTPKQEGSGDPSPTNVRNIVPWDGLTVWNGGKNLFNKDTAVTGVWWKGNILTGGYYANYRASDKIPVLPNVRYILTRQSQQQGAVCYFNKNKQYIDQQTWDRYTPSRVIPDGVYYVSFTVEAEYIDSAQFEVGQTETAYEPYVPITETDISFLSPVYGGTLDAVSGVLTVEYVFVQLLWSDGQFPSDIGDVTRKRFQLTENVVDINPYDLCDVAPFKVNYNSNDVHFYVNGTNNSVFIFLPNETAEDTEITVATKLKQPQEIQLTPAQITALVGNNTLWSDANGSMTAIYLKKG